MPAHTPIDRAAKRLNVTAEKLWELQGFGWISIVEKNGMHFILGHHEYIKPISGTEVYLPSTTLRD